MSEKQSSSETRIAPKITGQNSESLEQRRAQLTQIGTILQSPENRDGFIKAREDANKALAENKIILKNRFVLESTLGAGGMGTVYKAQDLRKVEARDTHPYVATKVLNADFKEHPDSFIALQREASRSSKLAHPNIVTVHDFDRDGDTIYMTMELLQGEDLDSLLARHQKSGLPKAEAVRIIADYCRALSFAHKKGIIHCDLKPANIFITKEGAKVLDFGIAQLAMQNQDHFDAGKMGALTPSYASVDMFNNEQPDQSDDVFAAAIIAYELLSGKHPFQRKSAPAALAINMEPKPIDGLSKREWRALAQGLKLRKADRTKTIAEFAEALTEKPKFPLFKVVSAVLLTAVAGFAYLQFFAENELKSVVKETLKTASECYQIGDFNCAIGGAQTILNLDPDHDKAAELLQLAEQAKAEQDKQLKIEQLVNNASNCMANSNYACAIDSSREALSLDRNHPQATKLLAQAENAQAEIQAAYQKRISNAQQCLDQQDYDCAKAEAALALEIIPQSSEAISIQQSVDYALKQAEQAQSQAMAKAKSILQDGQKCFSKYDYSCAIAKSESALEFVPDYEPALKLKKAAQKAISDAKKGIQIE